MPSFSRQMRRGASNTDDMRDTPSRAIIDLPRRTRQSIVLSPSWRRASTVYVAVGILNLAFLPALIHV
jgi:hypothetical protein